MRSLRRHVAPPVRHAVAAVLYLALATATVVIVRRDPGLALAGDSDTKLAAELAAGAILLAALAVAAAGAPDRRFPWLLAGAALAWPLAEWNNPGAGVAFTAGLLLSAAWPALLAAAALRRAPGRATLFVESFAFATSVGVLGLASAAVFDPAASGCRQCPANRLLVAGDTGAWHRLGQVGLALTVAWTAAFAGLMLARVARASAAGRRVIAPVAVPAVAAVALFGADALHGLGRGFLSNDPTDQALRLAEAGALVLVAGGLAWGRVRTWRTRTALTRLVVELGASPPPGGLREQLAGALGDPSLELLHGFDGGAGWIDAQGSAATLPTDESREATPIVAGGREISVIVHRRGLLDDPALASEVAAITRLALEHERLHASRRAHLEQLRASRARVVSKADAERRRLERDLHDGAQQRLVALALWVRLARRRLAAADAGLERDLAATEARLTTAVGELRELAHGLFPTVLATEGLAAALEALAEHAPQLVPGALPDGRCAAPVEYAAYFVVAEALRLAPEHEVAVDARLHDGRLVVQVRAEAGLAPAPASLEDRVGAVGGTLVAEPHALRAELPCAL